MRNLTMKNIILIALASLFASSATIAKTVTLQLSNGETISLNNTAGSTWQTNFTLPEGVTFEIVEEDEAATYYTHGDHLDTTQVITDENQNVVWETNQKPFGEVEITTEEIVYNLRFPGQYYDAESGLYYNYYRYYDPELGRYITSDPIGLNGGSNTYEYAESNPSSNTDSRGLVSSKLGSRKSNPWNDYQKSTGGLGLSKGDIRIGYWYKVAADRQSRLHGFIDPRNNATHNLVQSISDAFGFPNLYWETPATEGGCWIGPDFDYVYRCRNPNKPPSNPDMCTESDSMPDFVDYTTSKPRPPLPECIFIDRVEKSFGWICPAQEPYEVTPDVQPYAIPIQ